MKKICSIVPLLFVLLIGCCTNAQTDLMEQVENSEAVAFVPKDQYDAETYDGLHVELTFWSRDSIEPYGLWGPAATLVQEDPEVEILEEEEPSASVDGYYEIKTWPDFVVRSFIAYEGEHTHEGFQTVYLLITAREDICTYRGIHVGSSLEDLLAAYPDLCNTMDEWLKAYWASGFNGELMYTPEEYQGSLAPGLYFTIENDFVSKMELRYVPQRYEF